MGLRRLCVEEVWEPHHWTSRSSTDGRQMSVCAPSWSASVTWTWHKIWLTKHLPAPGHRGARSAGIPRRGHGWSGPR
jgi:hypothetical protein